MTMNNEEMIQENDRLAKVAGAQALEIAELRKQVAERDALLAEKDAALKTTLAIHCGDNQTEYISITVNKALSKNLPSAALERALAAAKLEWEAELVKQFAVPQKI
jgi:hypothetical protein